MKKNIFISLLMAVLLATGCSEKDLIKFDSAPAVHFLGDSVRHKSFLFDHSEVVLDTIWIRVESTGDLSDRERPFTLEQIVEYPELTYIKDEHGTVIDSIIDAVSGVHYVALNDPIISDYLFIPADKPSVEVPVILKRHSDLGKRVYRIKLQLKTNEYFGTNYVNTMLTRTIYASDIISKPGNWESARMVLIYFGKFSIRKFRLMLDMADGTIIDEAFLAGLNTSTATYWQRKFQMAVDEYNREVDEYNDTHEDKKEYLRDENGELVQFKS